MVKKQRLGGVVEALATGAIGWQSVPGADLDVQQIANVASIRRGSGGE